MKEKGEFLREYRITEEEFKAADISWKMLSDIYEYYAERKDKLAEVREELSNELFENPREISLHSVYWRIKEPEHLIAKIIRKKNSNYRKYRLIDKSNYWKIVRDLLGFRGLIIFREEWPFVHQKIHLVGLADELGAFYMGLADEIKKENREFLYMEEKAGGNIPDIHDTSDKQDMRTPNACLENILQS